MTFKRAFSCEKFNVTGDFGEDLFEAFEETS